MEITNLSISIHKWLVSKTKKKMHVNHFFLGREEKFKHIVYNLKEEKMYAKIGNFLTGR